LDQHFLPLCLTSGVAAGCAFPAAGVEAAKLNLSTAVTFCMFVIAGVQLRQEEAFKALQAKGEMGGRRRSGASAAARRARQRYGVASHRCSHGCVSSVAGYQQGIDELQLFRAAKNTERHTPRPRPLLWW
jgi:hypothetical protein